MNGVEFNEGQPTQINNVAFSAPERKSSKMAQFLIRNNLVETEAAANKVLLGLAVVFLVSTIASYFFFSAKSIKINPSDQESIKSMTEGKERNPNI